MSTYTNAPTEVTNTATNGLYLKWMPCYVLPDGSEEYKWIADTAAFPDWGVWGEGDTREEALADLWAVIRDLIEWDWTPHWTDPGGASDG